MSSQSAPYPLKIRVLRAILKFRMRVSEWVTYLANFVLPGPKGSFHRVIIFGQGRSGSTLLESLISSGPDFSPNGEILSPVMIVLHWPMKFLMGKCKMARSNFIFHLKKHHLIQGRKHPIDARRFLIDLEKKGWKIIYLRRENKLMHALSNIVAQNRGAYHKFDSSEEQLKIHLDVIQLETYVTNRIKNSDQENEILEGLKYEEVIYERDLELAQYHQQTADRIFQFIGVSSVQVKTKHRKVNAKTLKETFSNYDELIACVVRNGWTHFLTGEDREQIS